MLFRSFLVEPPPSHDLERARTGLLLEWTRIDGDSLAANNSWGPVGWSPTPMLQASGRDGAAHPPEAAPVPAEPPKPPIFGGAAAEPPVLAPLRPPPPPPSPLDLPVPPMQGPPPIPLQQLGQAAGPVPMFGHGGTPPPFAPVGPPEAFGPAPTPPRPGPSGAHLPAEQDFFGQREDENTDEIPVGRPAPKQKLGWVPFAIGGALVCVLAAIAWTLAQGPLPGADPRVGEGRPKPPVAVAPTGQVGASAALPVEPTAPSGPVVVAPAAPGETGQQAAPPEPGPAPTGMLAPGLATGSVAASGVGPEPVPVVAAAGPTGSAVEPKPPEPGAATGPTGAAFEPKPPEPVAAVGPTGAVVAPQPADPVAAGPTGATGEAKGPTAAAEPGGPKKPPPAADPEAEFGRMVKQAKAAITAERFKSAVVSYRRALVLKPESTEAKAGLGISLVMSDTSYREAVGLLETALKADDTNARAWLALGMAYQNTGRDAKAWGPYKKYLLLDPAGPSAGEIRAMLKANGQ